MVTHWLTNKSRFCISEQYETENDGRCYWGLPSISADDPTYPPLGAHMHHGRSRAPRARHSCSLVSQNRALRSSS